MKSKQLPLPDRESRDAGICVLAEQGYTLQQIAGGVGLSRQRVQQILVKRGVKIKRESVRSEFLGVNVTDSVKTALKQEAEKQGKSISSLASDTLIDMLAEKDYPVAIEE